MDQTLGWTEDYNPLIRIAKGLRMSSVLPKNALWKTNVNPVGGKGKTNVARWCRAVVVAMLDSSGTKWGNI
jgi:hypothetical protein